MLVSTAIGDRHWPTGQRCVSTHVTRKNALSMKDLINNRGTKTPEFQCLWMWFHSALPLLKPSVMLSPLSTQILTASFLWGALSTQRVTRGRHMSKSANEPELQCFWVWFTWETLQDVRPTGNRKNHLPNFIIFSGLPAWWIQSMFILYTTQAHIAALQ